MHGTPATGRNGLQVADGSDTAHAPPQLVVLACPPPPSPTPEPGCHIDTFTPAANGWTAWGSVQTSDGGQTVSLTFDHCEDDAFFRTAGVLFVDWGVLGQGWVAGNTLLQWDTSSLPTDAVVQDVSLNAVVLPGHNDPAASLTADWFDWGTSCGSEDFDTATAGFGNALSVSGACGEACFLPNIPALRNVTFPLDNGAAYLSHSADSPTQMRIRVDLGETPGADIIAVADLSSSFPPRLVVHWCEPDAPTPAATPTSTPTTPTPTPALGSCQLSEGCVVGTCVPNVTETGCVVTALQNNCTAVNWSPAVSNCSAPAANTGCCVLTSLQGVMCAGSSDGPSIMPLTEAGCHAICAAIEQWRPDCTFGAWGGGQACGDSPYSGCGGSASTPAPTPTPGVLGSCQLSDGCTAGTCVADQTEIGCVLLATSDNCTPLSWSPNVSDCSAPATNTGCCVINGIPDSGAVCVGNADGATTMSLTEAGCQAACQAISDAFAQALPDCSTVWGYGLSCGNSPYSACVAVNTPTPTPSPTP